jgi:tetratricopeptide (TPR) repeat protein
MHWFRLSFLTIVTTAPLVACALAGPEQSHSPLAQAHERLQRGNFAEAQALFTRLRDEPKWAEAATVGLARTYCSVGRYEDALKLLEQVDSIEGLTERAELYYRLGRLDAAEQTATQVLARAKGHLAAEWVRARVLRDRGDLAGADRACQQIVREYNSRAQAGKAIRAPEELLVVGLAGAENARRHSLPKQFRFVLNEVFGDAAQLGKHFWQVDYHAGMLLLEKYNRAEALEAFDDALRINPQAAEAIVGKGLAALQVYELRQADRFADQALRINPNLIEALRLKADVHLMSDEIQAALEPLTKARKVNPRDEATLARLAACYFLLNRERELTAIIAEVEKANPHCGLFYSELAERLEERKRFTAAREYFRKAIALNPNLPAPRNGLALLELRLGDEREAQKLLEAAFEKDQFNVRVANSLKVLRHLAGYHTIETKRFILRYHPKTDAILGPILADYLDELFDEFSRQYRFEPQQRLLVELFNNHDMFSGRVVGLPDLHTIGACTGRVIALVSPQEPGRPKFNWGRVIRHELTHFFNLEQTNMLVPHWFTEGLAVRAEGFARPPAWNKILADRFNASQLLTLDSINLAFIRPRTPQEWQLAYCQSHLYIEYLAATYGEDLIPKMLDAFGRGQTTRDVIEDLCQVKVDEFERDYQAYVELVVKQIDQTSGQAQERNFAQLLQIYDENPDDLDNTAQLAWQYAERNRREEARRLAAEVLSQRQRHPLATAVKARLLLAAGDSASAVKLLEEALDMKAPPPQGLLILGQAYFERGEFARAAERFELGGKLQPGEPRWWQEAAKAHARAGQTAGQIAALQKLTRLDPDDLQTRKQLTRLLLDAKRHAEALASAREALQIDVMDGAVQRMLLEALRGVGKEAEAQRLAKRLGQP